MSQMMETENQGLREEPERDWKVKAAVEPVVIERWGPRWGQ